MSAAACTVHTVTPVLRHYTTRMYVITRIDKPQKLNIISIYIQLTTPAFASHVANVASVE